MKNRFVLLCLSALLASTALLSACEPAIPHQIEGRNDCISCHGPSGVKPYPAFHAKRGFGNDDCTKCHAPRPDTV